MIEAVSERAMAIQQEAHRRDQHYQHYISQMQQRSEKGKGRLLMDSDEPDSEDDEDFYEGVERVNERGEDVDMEEPGEAASDVSLRSSYLYQYSKACFSCSSKHKTKRCQMQ